MEKPQEELKCDNSDQKPEIDVEVSENKELDCKETIVEKENQDS